MSLSALLPLSGGVAFSELLKAEGRKGGVNDVANGLDRRESDRYLGDSKLGQRKRKRRVFKPLKSSVGDWRGDEEAWMKQEEKILGGGGSWTWE